jgi:formimidoylglutamate deiminase
MPKYFRFKALLQNEGWLQPAFIGVDDDGKILSVSKHPPDDQAIEAVEGIVLPGFQNAHSHAFQYAMAGLAENHPTGISDDFWTWREEMYRCALSLNPDQAEVVASMVYSEMVRYGYTHVAEFHYLHHDEQGKPYANLAEIGERMVGAAGQAGIGITLIPVFYQKGNFGKDPSEGQRRFISKTVDAYFRLLEASAAVVSKHPHARLGFSVHSPRAVDLADIQRTFEHGPRDLPFHLHIAEQKKEVEDCLMYCKKRPVQWLLDSLPVDERFFLVHATHLNDDEVTRLAKSKANVVLCPSTEGNLGDGIFRMKEFVGSGGRWCIGSDSQIGLNPLEEFRMIDYRQRLTTNRRNTFEGDAAMYLMNESVNCGRSAMGIESKNNFATGDFFDAAVFDGQGPLVANTKIDRFAATIVYSPDSSPLLGTICKGQWIVKNNRHVRQKELRSAFGHTMRQLQTR